MCRLEVCILHPTVDVSMREREWHWGKKYGEKQSEKSALHGRMITGYYVFEKVINSNLYLTLKIDKVK